jgi:hypothetical protein
LGGAGEGSGACEFLSLDILYLDLFVVWPGGRNLWREWLGKVHLADDECVVIDSGKKIVGLEQEGCGKKSRDVWIF